MGVSAGSPGMRQQAALMRTVPQTAAPLLGERRRGVGPKTSEEEEGSEAVMRTRMADSPTRMEATWPASTTSHGAM